MQDLLEQADLWLQRRDSPQFGSVTIGLFRTNRVLRYFLIFPRRVAWQQESFSYRGQKFTQVPTLGLDLSVGVGFQRLSPMTSLHSLNLSPMGVNSSSLARCRLGVEVWRVLALTFTEWFLERQGRYCLTCFFLKSQGLFLYIPKHCCVIAMQSSLFPSFSFSAFSTFSALLASLLASTLLVLINSFLLLITFLFF